MERVNLTNNESSDDTSETPSSSRRSPMEVVRDWWDDRQKMIEHDGVERNKHESDDDEDDDSPETTKKKRVGRVLRGLFRKHVERTPAESEESASTVAETPERSFLGGVLVDAAEAAPETPIEAPVTTPEAIAKDTVEPVEPLKPTEVSPDEVTPPEIEPEIEEEPEEETPAPVSHTPTPETPATQPPELDDAEPPTATVNQAYAAGGPPVPPNVLYGAAAPGGGASTPGGVGHNASPPSTHTIERERIIERKGSNALPIVLVGAEFLVRRRQDRKIRETIEKESKASQKQHEATQERLNHLENERDKQRRNHIEPKPTERKTEQPYKQRPIAENPARPKPESPARAQSVAEVLKATDRQSTAETKPAPSLADLERRYATSPAETYENKDILEVAEQLATRANERSISHETFDERWHEIKDTDDAIDASAALTDAIMPSSLFAPDKAPLRDPRVSREATPEIMLDPSQPSANKTTNKLAVSGMWTALVIGVVVAVIVILTSLA